MSNLREALYVVLNNKPRVQVRETAAGIRLTLWSESAIIEHEVDLPPVEARAVGYGMVRYANRLLAAQSAEEST